MRFFGRGKQTGGRRVTASTAQWRVAGSVPAWCRRAWAWARRSMAGAGLPVSPERPDRRESSSASPAASACPGPDGGAAGRGLSGVFRRPGLKMRRRADGGPASAANPGNGTGRREPGRVRVRSLAARGLAAGLLAAFAALLALPLQGHAQTSIPHDWSLKPSGLDTRDKFRLLFVSSTKRNANPTAIATYNTFVQTRAAAGHTDIQTYSAGFKVVGCTATVDAIDNTGTTGTGVPIYWLDGDKVADDYADFYDGSWDSRSPTTETGASVTTTSTDGVITGCTAIGTDGGFALGDGTSASMGNPSGSNSGLYSANLSPLADSRRLYGLSVVFEVRASTDATLSALVVNDGTNDRTLDLVPGTFDYDADVGNAVTTVTLTATVNNSNASVTGVTLDGTAIADTDFSDGITVPSLAEDDNEIVVTVTPESGATKTYTITVTRARRRTTTPTPPGEVEVPNDWSLIPTGLAAGDKFRLLFLSSTNTDGTSYDIADYNTFVQGRAAAGHTDIQAYSSAFRAVGCTSDSDATANTGAYNSAGTGVPIHWLNGNKVADDYPDFYDGSWDDEANDKNELGDNGPDTSQTANFPLTGCQDYGEEANLGGRSLALGQPTPRVGRPNSSATNAGPIHSLSFVGPSDPRPMYGLSQVFEVGAPTDVTLRDLELEGAPGGETIVLIPAFDSATETYTASVANRIAAVTLTATKNDTNATVAIASDDDTSTEGEAELDLSVGSNTLTLTLTAEDATPKSYTITVTRATAPPAPTDCPADTDWCTTLGVGHFTLPTNVSIFEEFGYQASVNLGDLRSTMFSHGGTSYTVSFLNQTKATSLDGNTVLTGKLSITTSQTLPDGTVLQLGSRTFTVDTDSATNTPNQESWDIRANPLSWTAGQHVTVSLKFPTAVKTPRAISIADASAAENAGHLLFEVTLSRALQNTVKVDFETISGGTATEGVDYYARRTYTHVILAGDKTAQMGFALIEDTVNRRRRDGEGKAQQRARGRCVRRQNKGPRHHDRRGDGNDHRAATTTTNVPGLTIGIQDATGDEDDGWLDFRVRLSRKYDDYVCYDFETISGGTATEGTDYLKFPKATYWMQIGKRVDKPFVRIIDDSVNDNGETVKVKISNARLCDDASQTVSITRAEATGTITNSDPMPQAWLARFGRTVADQVLDAVEGRMTAPRAPGTELSVAGQRVGGGSAAAPVAVDTGEAEAGLEALAEWLRDEEDEDRTGFESRPVAGRDILTGSSFAFTEGSAEGGFGAVWGRGAISRFDGREGDLTLDGEVASAMVGADWTGGRGSAGLAVAHSRGEGDYRSPAGGGAVESTLTGVYPYGRYDVSERLSLWGVVGYGTGTLTLTPEGQAPIETDMDLSMAAVGGRSVVVKPPADGGLELAATADAMVVQTASDEVRGSAGSIAASEAEVTRVRFGFEGTWRGIGTEGGGSLVPGFEIGVRQDGGDAETGFGADIGAGIAWSDPAHGIAADVRARGLLTHEDGSFRERGFAGSFAWDPDPASDLGPSLTLRQTVGASATGGADALLAPESAQALIAANDEEDDVRNRRLEATLGYGIPAFGGRYTTTPAIGFGLTEAEREYSHSWRLAEAKSAGLVFGLDVEAVRREHVTGDTGPEHRFVFGLGWQLEGAGREGAAFGVRLEGSRSDTANDNARPETVIAIRVMTIW